MAEKKLRVQDTVFNLDTFTEVTLVKEVPFAPVSTVAEALAALGNDDNALLAVINKGLESNARKDAKSVPTGWHTFTEEGEVNGEFSGTPADIKKVNALVLTLAKTVFGYDNNAPLAEKKAAKESAKAMIQGNTQIREGLKKSAALTAEDEDES